MNPIEIHNARTELTAEINRLEAAINYLTSINASEAKNTEKRRDEIVLITDKVAKLKEEREKLDLPSVVYEVGDYFIDEWDSFWKICSIANSSWKYSLYKAIYPVIGMASNLDGKDSLRLATLEEIERFLRQNCKVKIGDNVQRKESSASFKVEEIIFNRKNDYKGGFSFCVTDYKEKYFLIASGNYRSVPVELVNIIPQKRLYDNGFYLTKSGNEIKIEKDYYYRDEKFDSIILSKSKIRELLED